MNIRPLLNMTCVITNTAPSTDRDEFGDLTDSTSTRTYRGWIHQEQRSEITGNTDVQYESWRLYLEPAADGHVDGSARVAVGGNDYEFDGPPWTVTHPVSLTISHLEARIVRTR